MIINVFFMTYLKFNAISEHFMQYFGETSPNPHQTSPYRQKTEIFAKPRRNLEIASKTEIFAKPRQTLTISAKNRDFRETSPKPRDSIKNRDFRETSPNPHQTLTKPSPNRQNTEIFAKPPTLFMKSYSSSKSILKFKSVKLSQNLMRQMIKKFFQEKPVKLTRYRIHLESSP